MGSGQMLRGGRAAAGRQQAHQLAAAAPVAAAAGQLKAVAGQLTAAAPLAVNTRQSHPAVGAAGPSDVAAPANGRNPTATMTDSSSGALYPLLVWHLLLAGNIISSSGGGRGGTQRPGWELHYAICCACTMCLCINYRQVHKNCTKSLFAPYQARAFFERDFSNQKLSFACTCAAAQAARWSSFTEGSRKQDEWGTAARSCVKQQGT